MEDKRLNSAANQAVRQRNYRRARDRALVRLAHAYPNKYLELLEEEKARDEKEGKTWLDIRGRTNGGANAAGRPSSKSTVESKQTKRIKVPASNDGGEA